MYNGCILIIDIVNRIINSDLSSDIDECASGSNQCARNADCLNTPASYSCSCHNGYRGDGRVCQGYIM